MLQQKTHRKVKDPQISGRYLADYMAASEEAKRTIVRNSKYQSAARVVQHNEAKLQVAKFIRGGSNNVGGLLGAAQELRDRWTDDPFQRDVWDHNADYIDRVAAVPPDLGLPEADLLPAGQCPSVHLNGVKVTAEIHFRLRRLTKTNKFRSGAAILRYAKNKPLPEVVAEWQSAFLFGYLNMLKPEDGVEPEHKLCLTVDAYSGVCHPAPTNSIRRFRNMKAACASIAERWDNIPPPPNAVF